MNCYLHPEKEAVSVCGQCGVGLCKECEENAFFRQNNGTGQALCNRCSLESAQNNVNFTKSWLSKRMTKLIFCSIFVIAGLISFINCYSNGDTGEGIFYTIIIWAIAGVIANIGATKDKTVTTQDIKDAVYDYDHPISSFVIKVVLSAFFAPILLISNFVGYQKTKTIYLKDLEALNQIKASLNITE